MSRVKAISRRAPLQEEGLRVWGQALRQAQRRHVSSTAKEGYDPARAGVGRPVVRQIRKLGVDGVLQRIPAGKRNQLSIANKAKAPQEGHPLPVRHLSLFVPADFFVNGGDDLGALLR